MCFGRRGGLALPVHVRLFLPRRYTASGNVDRNVVLGEFILGGLHGVAYASYTLEIVGTLLAASVGGSNLMYRLAREDPLRADSVPPTEYPERV